MADADLRKAVADAAKALLARPPLRRGAWLISDKALRKAIRDASTPAQEPPR